MRYLFDERQVVIARSALNVLVDGYREIADHEELENEKANLIAFANSGFDLLGRFRRLDRGEFDISHGEFSVLERAYRMSVSAWQRLVRPGMSAEQKALHREGADEAAAELSRLRRTRGLPW